MCLEDFPFVSIIVPNYNHARYLKQRLDSVFGQTYSNFEVIILDDCSTDNSLEVINRYKDDPHLSQIVSNKENSGSVFKQWKKGFELAKGEYIWIAESDDYCTPEFLEVLINECQKHKNVAVAFSNYVLCDENNNIIRKEREKKNACFDGKAFVRRRLARCCDIHNASGAIFKKSILSNISERFLSFKNTGDYQFWCEAAACGNVVKVRKNLTFWRQSISSVTGNNFSKGITSREDRLVYDYICSQYKLNLWERYLVYAQHIAGYRGSTFDNEMIKQDILNQWKDGYAHNSWLDRKLFWFVGSVERHLGLLL